MLAVTAQPCEKAEITRRHWSLVKFEVLAATGAVQLC
jgi:hypothetical protein